MHLKKRYLVIALFLLIGLTTATFANPIEELDSQKTSSKEQDVITKKEESKNTYNKAVEAVEIAEENPTLDTIENARIVIQNVENLTNNQAQQLQNRIESAEETIDIAALVTELENLVEEKETIEEAKAQYPIVEAEVNRLNEGNVKENLQTRIEIVASILNDTEAPTITGITNGSIVNKSENIYINDKFLENVKITGPNSKGEVVTKEYVKDDFTEDTESRNFSFKYNANYEGIWTVVATDKAGNSYTESFTIDKTAPKFIGLKNGSHYEKIKVLVDDETATIVVKNMDTKQSEEVSNGKELETDATYYITATDEAGNMAEIWLAIDTKAPTITGITNGSVVNKSENIYVNDKFLEIVKITGPNSKGKVETKTFTRADFTVGTNNENFSFTYKANYEGIWTVVATDKAGNSYTESFTIDRTAPTATITKSNNDKSTNQDVTVTLKAEEEILTPEGWTVVTEGFEFTKVYSQDGKYEVVITDKAGNKSTIKYEVKRIDKVAPTATVTKSNNDKSTNQDVTVTIVADEAIYKPAGWTEVKTNKEHEFTKVYSENGIYEIEIKDKAKNTSTITFEVKNIDKVAPTLTLNGEKNITLEAGIDVYEELGVRVTDNVDETIESLEPTMINFTAPDGTKETWLKEVDTTRVGEYKISYKYEDTAGNKGLDTQDQRHNYIIRIVNVVDTIKPEFVVEKGYNENGINPYIKVNDLTDISFKVYRKGTEKPIHEFNSSTTGKSFKIGWHGAGIYTIVAIDAGGNETTKEFEVYHNLNTVDALVKAFEKGGKAVLTQNVTLDKAVELKEGVNLEIDLNEYELKVSNPLSDTYDKNDSTRLIKNKGNLVIKNGNLTNEKIHSYGIIDNYGTLLLEKIKVQDNGSYDGSTIKNREGKVIIADSDFNISSSTGYKTTETEKNVKFGNAATYSDGELEIRNTSIKSDSERAYTFIVNSGTAKVENVTAKGYHGGLATNGGTITINDMKYESDVHYGIYISNKNKTDITINGGEFIGQLQGLLIYNEYDKADVKVTVNGGTFRSKTGAPAAEVVKNKATHKMDLIIKGGKFENTKLKAEYIADGYVQNESYEVVKNSISVTTGNELKELFSNAKNVEGKTIVLENDLDMTGVEWNALDNVSFILDGNGHTIKNLTYTTNDYIGIFVNHSAAKNLKFKNLTIDNANLKTTSTKDNIAAGFFVGDADTADSIIIENCTVKNSSLTAYDYAGGFIGYTAGWDVVNDGPVYSDILIEDCKFINNTITSGGAVGGAVAHAGGNPDTTVAVKNFTAKNNILNGEAGKNKTGIVIGTAHVGKTILENITQANNTILGIENSNAIYGRFVPNSTGTLTIDGIKITN